VYTVRVQARDIYGYYSEWIEHDIHISGLEIGSIKGGIGITTTIRNIGDITKDVEWNVEAVGGTIPGFHFKHSTEGSVLAVKPGESFTMSTGAMFGLGNFKFMVTAECGGEPIQQKTIDGFILFFYIFI
jgi:hypothetical protein